MLCSVEEQIRKKKGEIESSRSDARLPYKDFRCVVPFNQHDFETERLFKNFSRNYNIDLAPKILFSKSASVEHCIDSGVANYLEF